ncbi:HEPN domain-containing protein [Chthonobacter rhizosphaerae]|uniref:HEPN domain-containing protein n=1 Tax=Chthonobacter rhizosphaerae TaxID=2735553 RepID=UPI0015EE49C3|nr:HEPN domain-containing protein [Chthonobacter rhizosphaerae]
MTDLRAKSAEALAAARLLLNAGDADGAANRAYYAVFNAVRDLLATVEGVDLATIKTHRTVSRLFSEAFVKTGRMPAHHGRELHRLFEARAVADYDLASVGLDEARRDVDMAAEIVAAAALLTDSRRGPSEDTP